MSKALSIFDPSNVPDHIKTFNEGASNIGPKLSVDSLTYKGKIWTVAVGGTKTPLMKKTEDGDEEPRSIIPLVILDYNARRGRSWYEHGYEEGKPQIPACWSPDGIAPSPDSAKRQSDKCSTCAKAVKGSKMSDSGNPITACQQYRMAAVQLYRRWDLPPLRLRLAITSDYDARGKDNEAKGWYAFQQLMDLLRSRGVKHTASVVVRAKFDPAVPHPKVLFSPVGWTTEEEIEILAPISESEAVKNLLSPTYTPNGGDGHSVTEAPPAEEEPEEDGPAPAPAPQARASVKVSVKPKSTPAPAPAPVADPDEDEDEAAPQAEAGDDISAIVEEAEEDEEDADAKAAQKAAAAQAAAAEKQAAKVKAAQEQAAKAKAAAKAQAPDDDDDEVITVTPVKATPVKTKTNGAAAPAAKAAAPAPKPASKAAPAPKPVSPAVGAMLQDWQDDE